MVMLPKFKLERMKSVRIYHPQVSYQGLPPENVFFVADQVGRQQGMGSILPFYQPEIFPNQPLNLYIEITAPDRYKHVLLGGLLARSYQIRSQTPQLKAWVYTQTDIKDAATLGFWQENGFSLDDAEDLVRFSSSFIPGKLPMGATINGVSLQNLYEQQSFLQRLNHYRISEIDIHFLSRLMQQPHFLPLAVHRGGEIIAEALLSGHGNQGNLIALYVKNPYRKMGIGKTLLHRGLTILQSQGVTQCDGLILRRSIAQQGFARSLKASFIKTTCYYPGMNI